MSDEPRFLPPITSEFTPEEGSTEEIDLTEDVFSPEAVPAEETPSPTDEVVPSDDIVLPPTDTLENEPSPLAETPSQAMPSMTSAWPMLNRPDNQPLDTLWGGLPTIPTPPVEMPPPLPPVKTPVAENPSDLPPAIPVPETPSIVTIPPLELPLGPPSAETESVAVEPVPVEPTPIRIPIPPREPVPAPLEQQASIPTDSAPESVLEPEPELQLPEPIRLRALEMLRHGYSLAQRGAYYSGRAEFIQTLRLVAQSLDAQTGTRCHSEALAAGMQALKEADDFIPRGDRLEADVNVADFVEVHRTPILKDAPALEEMPPLAALQHYYTYAQRQLALAGGDEPAASLALYALGKIEMHKGDRPGDGSLECPKAMAFHQAALMVDERNYMAANELGVLLARYGQLDQSKQVLLHALRQSPHAETWHNLAVVHQRLGEVRLAQLAEMEYQRAGGGEPAQTEQADGQGDGPIRWVSPEVFAREAPAETHAAIQPFTTGSAVKPR